MLLSVAHVLLITLAVTLAPNRALSTTPSFLPSPPPRSRQLSPPCQLSADGPPVRKVLQLNGTADYFLHFSLCPVSAPVAALDLVDFSTDSDVLRVSAAAETQSDVHLDRVYSDTSACHNVSASFSFDRMVGLVTYRLVAKAPAANKILCSTYVAFVVVGFTVYTERPLEPSPAEDADVSALGGNAQVEKVILSGDGNEVISDYRENLVHQFKQFKIKIQFPDGGDSSTRSHEYVASILEDMTTKADADATSPIRFEDTKKSIINPEEHIQNASCGAAIDTVIEPTGGTSVLFSLRYESYKDGLITLLFEWDLLTKDDPELADDHFVNVLYISVIGDPPPIIESIQPPGPYRRAGGERLVFVLDNVKDSNMRDLRVGNRHFHELEGSFRQRSDGLYEAVYITGPGNETDLEWNLYVSFPDRTRRAKITGFNIAAQMAYISTPLTITALNPAVGTAGDYVSITGYFDGFDPSKDNHDIFFGQKTLRLLGIVPVVNNEGTLISILIPPREEVGAAYAYEIRVVVSSETSTSATFTFTLESLSMAIDVYGTSYNQEIQQNELGGCTISRYIASLPSGVMEPESYMWAVVHLADPEKKNIIFKDRNTQATTKSLLLLPNVFGGKEGKFRVSVSCVINGEALTSEVVVHKLSAPIIGLTLSVIRPRSIAIPDVPVRVSAIVIPPRPECFNRSSKILYSWSYRDVVQQFSYQNFSSSSMNGSSAPARLGREYVIPQESLAIGTFVVALTAFMQDSPEVSGNASSLLTIHPSPLVPVIGYGASKVVHSGSNDLILTGENSYNPDEKYGGNDSHIDHYLWGCKVSSFTFNPSDARDCHHTLLPNKTTISFIVPKAYLQQMKASAFTEDQPVAFSIQYSLSVGSRGTISPKKYQIIEIIADNFEVAKLDGLQMMNNRGESVDWSKIESFSDIIIEPYGKNISWSFQIISPPSSSLMLKKSSNLIIHPGYFDPSSSAMTQVLPLGIRGGSLSHAQTYEIAVSISSKQAGVERGEARFLVQTLDKPKLIIPDLPIVYGDSETVFTAYAQVNLDTSHEFLYFFYLVDSEGDEYCLDGCGGHHCVQFKLAEAGTYRIAIRLMDMQGKSLLDEAFFARNVTMSSSNFEVSALSSGTNLGDFDSKLRDLYYLGDHGTFELLASSLASRVRKDEMYASSEDDTRVLDLAVEAMHQIVQNSAPTTMTSKSYVTTALRFAAMDAELFASPQTMYTILSMVDKAISNVPVNEAFDLEEALLSFYNMSAKHVINALTSSSTRTRLRQFSSSSPLDSRSLLVDLYRLQEEHLTTVIARDAQCGMVRHLDSLVPDGVPPPDIDDFIITKETVRSRRLMQRSYFDVLSSYESLIEQPSYTSFTIAVLCNPDQADGIRGERTSFTWCDEVFGTFHDQANGEAYKIDPQQKRLFTVMETLDFVWLSGLGGDDARTDSNFLVTTNVTALESDGSLLAPPEIAGCYKVNTSIIRLGITPTRGCLSAEAYMVQALGRPFEPKVISQNYKKNYTAVTSSLSKDWSSTILLKSSNPGIYGVYGQDCPVNAQKPTLALPDGGSTKFVYYAFAGVMVALLLVLLTWIGTSFVPSHFASSAA